MTFEEPKRRSERQDFTFLRCHLALENEPHCIVHCFSNVAHLQNFRIEMLRIMRTHLNIFHPQISAREVLHGWSLTTYDNHDRRKVLLQGENSSK